MQGEAEEVVFSLKSFQDILDFKQCTPQDYTHKERTELEQFFDSVGKCTHSEKNSSEPKDNYGILAEKTITE